MKDVSSRHEGKSVIDSSVAEKQYPGKRPPRKCDSRIRYKVLAFTVGLAAITFLDRVCISMTAPDMTRDLSLTDFEMSLVFSSFTLAYGLFEIPTGWWGDRVGTRRVLTRIVVWWSAFTIATATAFNLPYLLVVRFLFGAGEAGAFPNVASTHKRWFPATERGRVQGIFFMGAHLGGGLTPLLVTGILSFASWRMVFVLCGIIGFIWAVAWYRWFRDDPALHAAVSQSELRYIRDGKQPETGHLVRVSWKNLLSDPNLMALCLMYFSVGYGAYFFVTWFPSYLQRERGFSGGTLGVLAGMPMILSILADLLGGVTTDHITSKYGLRLGRSGVGGIALFLAGMFMTIGTAARMDLLSAVSISVAFAAGNFALGASWGACLDMAESHSGVISACMNTAGQLGGVISPIVLAFILDRTSNWAVPLYVTSVLYLFGALCWWFIDPRKPISAVASRSSLFDNSAPR